MKVTCHREGLLSAFSLAASVAPQRSPKPILRNAKLTVRDDGWAELAATDQELGVRYRVAGMAVDRAGTAILPTAETIAILRELPDEQVRLEELPNGILLRGQSSRFTLPIEDVHLFPDFGEESDAVTLQVPAGVLSAMIRRTSFAVAPENARYALHSVLIEHEGAQCRFVATDGKRMALMPGVVELVGTMPTTPVLVPPKALALVQKTLQDPQETVDITLSANDAQFRTGKVTIWTRLVEGRFPRYQEVIPQEVSVTVPLVVNHFQAALRQAKIVVSAESQGVDFHFESGELTMESRGVEAGQAEIKMPVPFEGDAFDITFDPQLLLDALRMLDATEEITLNMVDNRRATVLRNLEGYIYVVMPLTKDRK